MRASTEILLKENLKALRLSHMQGHLDALLRQAKENGFIRLMRTSAYEGGRAAV